MQKQNGVVLAFNGSGSGRRSLTSNRLPDAIAAGAAILKNVSTRWLSAARAALSAARTAPGASSEIGQKRIATEAEACKQSACRCKGCSRRKHAKGSSPHRRQNKTSDPATISSERQLAERCKVCAGQERIADKPRSRPRFLRQAAGG